MFSSTCLALNKRIGQHLFIYLFIDFSHPFSVLQLFMLQLILTSFYHDKTDCVKTKISKVVINCCSFNSWTEIVYLKLLHR